jgi:ABC-type polysaccharide/polyol phosphate export permease
MGLSRYALLSPELLIRLRYRLTAENFRKASADLVAGWRRRAVWGTLGLREIRERQRSSRMGPFWSLIPLGTMLCLFGVIYGRVLDRNLADYLPYLAAGLLVWSLISGLMLDAERAFIMADGSGKRLRAPISIPLYRIAWVNLIILGYNLPLFLLVMLWFGKNPGWGLVIALPALFALLLNGIWLSLLVGVMSVRFLGLSRHLTRLIQVLFLMTPILWEREMLADWAVLAETNPLYYLIEILRSPLLGHFPSLPVLVGVALITLVGWALTLFVYTAVYWRLPYWSRAASEYFTSPDQSQEVMEPVPAPLPTSDQVPETTASLDAASLPLRALAFYLPQFHPIPENDRWWGPGFTEWTNVTRAHPQFLGHHQPRLPGALGFYDLRLAEVQREQVRLAHKYGLYGFCYHYYWFGGHRLLDRPLRQVLADPSLDLPFCICWANENWTRRWDGQEQEVLIGQQHSPADDLAFIAELEPIFRDPRYIRVDGQPLLLVYRPQLLPDPAATVARWRQHVQAQGLPGLYLAAVQSFSDAIDTDDTLFDALVEFPPHTVPRIDIGDRYQMLNPRFRGEILDYEACVDAAEAQVQERSDKVVFPGVMAAWDNTPRRRDLATIFANASPQAYGRWLTAACRRALAAPAADHRLVFINAWNEWAEGSYLEPDQRYGHAYLQATRDVLLDAAQGFPVANAAARARHLQAAASPQLLFVGHDAHRHGAQLLTLHLLRLFARRFGYRPRLWLLGDGALRPDYEAVAEVRLIEDVPDRLEEVASRLHAHGIRGAIVNTVVSAAVLPALASAGLRTLALIHEMPKLIYERGLEANAQAVVTHADMAIFATTTVLDAFRTLAPVAAERALVLPQGIYQTLTAPADARAQVAQELGLPPDALLVINVGYGDARKGFDLFLDAARLTVTADARFHFLWLGQIEASFGARLEQERQTPPLAGHLHQVPFTVEVGRYYQAADLFLLSSREDPFPSVVLEALACGLPVVAFAGSGGHCELLADAPLNGALVAMGQVRALAQSLRDQAALEAQAPERRPQRAAAARARFDFVAYGWELLRHLDPPLQRVSVVVPNYNYAHYLRARLESIFGQSYPVYEILVLDDASTDTSLKVLESCRRDWDRDLTLVTNDHNSGLVFAQWRQGIARAQGDLVWLAEADDQASPDFLASLAPRFATQPHLAFAFSDSVQLDDQGRCLGESYAAYCNEYSDLDYRQDFAVPGADFLAKGLGVRNTVLNASGVLFRRSALQAALDRVGPALSDWRIAGDWRLYAELCRAGGEVQYVARPLNQHRRHAESVVGANRLDQHLAEITAMHAELSPDLAAVPGLAQRQRDYLESLRRQARREAKNAGS